MSETGGPIIRVAVLDEHRLVAEGIASALSGDGILVVLAAWLWTDLLDHHEMPVDVAVVDIRLDDGVLISTRVRALAALGISTVVTSARTNPGAVGAAAQAGALAFVAKSDSIAELRRAVRTAATGGTHIANEPANALATSNPVRDPGLGRQEERALVLYASGRSIREVASDMHTTEETVKSYIKRGRRKFRQIGIDIGTRILLRRHASQHGWLGHE
ncbi:MAG: DNA-binding response regulator [Rhodoglobus sp.]|nr:DNA-binding response regulator [Rhodoglobus sp.]